MSANLPRIAILGAGSMGGAILAGLVDSGLATAGVAVTNRSVAKADAVRMPGVDSYALEATPDANQIALDGARVVIVGVKPAMVPDLLTEVASALAPDAVVVSVAAGVTTATMEALVPNAVARTMPNTPSLVRRGVTGLATGSRITAEDVALVRAVFETVGAVIELDEDRIDALSTISGSGPAYVFFLMEQLTGTALRLGFTPEEARLMVEKTFLGASELLASSDADPAELRRRVTSPNGTTMRAIAVMEEADLAGMFDRATAAALARAKEMAAETAG
jgi:pyrroline-5-carboxylate reductase